MARVMMPPASARQARHALAHGHPVLILALILSLAGPAPAQPLIRTPGDSVLARMGDAEQWVDLSGLTAADTINVGVAQDLVLIAGADTLRLSGAAGPTTICIALDAGTLCVPVLFGDESGRLLRERVALLRAHPDFAREPRAAPLVWEPLFPEAALEELRRAYPLDAIAGVGGDLDRMRNLRRWLNRTVPYDGLRENPGRRSIAATLAACADSGLTMNCGGMASTYVALCRAVGLRARQVVCRPQDPRDPDCHSVAVVYSDSLGQWVYMDPAFDAEWADEGGRPLDLQMARERLIRGEPVTVNADARLRGAPRDPAVHLAYMAKNLFWFQGWLDRRTTVHLVPVGYEEVHGATVREMEAAGTTVIVTRDPDRFYR